METFYWFVIFISLVQYYEVESNENGKNVVK